MNRLVRILADMVEAALDRHNSMRYDSSHETQVSDMRNEVLPDDELASVLQRQMQSEGFSDSARSKEGQ